LNAVRWTSVDAWYFNEPSALPVITVCSADLIIEIPHSGWA
jgi:hypothetical protein